MSQRASCTREGSTIVRGGSGGGKLRVTPAKPQVSAGLGLLSVALLVAAPARAQAEEQYDGKTEARVLEDDPLSKQLGVSFGLGFFSYRAYTAGGWGGDLTYSSPYFFALSGKLFATVDTRSDRADRKVRPFYDVAGSFHLYDGVNPGYADLRIYGTVGESGRSTAVRANARDTFSLRGGAFSWGVISPTAFAGISLARARYFTASIDELDTDRTHFASYKLYVDAVFPTMDPETGSNDRVGGRLGIEGKERNVGKWWNLWGGLELGYLRHGLIGRFFVGLTL